MCSYIYLAFLLCLSFATCEYDEEHLIAQLDLIDMDLEDECEDISTSIRNYLLNHPNAFQERTSIVEGHGKYLRRQSENLRKNFESEESYPYELARNLTLLIKNGDTVLPESDWKHLVRFHHSIEDLATTIRLPCIDNTPKCNLGKQDVKNILATSRNSSTLEHTWKAWQNIFALEEKRYNETLNLLHNATSANGLYNVKEYWEYLSETEDGYNIAKTLWEEIEPLYKKLYDFVLLRLNQHYGTNFTEIPVHLLGSNFGDDWSNIADIVLPKPQFLYDINVELEGLNTKHLYKLAEHITKDMGLGKFGKQFWSNSVFNMPDCDARVLSFCAHKYSEAFSCNNTTWKNYLDIHEAAIEIVLNNQDYASLARQRLRYSSFNEAFRSIGSILAIGNLPYNNILTPDVYKYEEANTTNTIAALLLTALRVLPKLPYYLAADLSRLDELEVPSGNFSASWWEMRQKYQGIAPSDGFEPDYIGDPYINSNRPYLSKFLGTILQFQILDYYQIRLYAEDYDMQQVFKQDGTLKDMLQDRPNKNPIDVVSYYYGINEYSSYNILDYFLPLEEYLANAPTDQEPIVKHGRRKVATKPPVRKIMPITEVIEVTEKPITDAIQNDVTKATEAPKPREEQSSSESTQKRNSYIFIGVACGLILLAVLYGAFSKCRKKMHKNNRRFGA